MIPVKYNQNSLHIETLEVDEAVDAANANGNQLTASQQAIARRDEMRTIMVQLAHLNRRQIEMNNQMQEAYRSLRVFVVTELNKINRNVRRLLTQPAMVVAARASTPAANAPAPAQAAQEAPAPVAMPNDEGLATLSPKPKSLMELWAEYINGIGGRKAARYFTSAERGRVKHMYCRRKLVWDCIELHVRCGYTPQAAIERIHQAYGYNLSITRILNCFKRDKATGGHPNLRC